MKEFINELYLNIETFILGIGYFGPILASLIIVFESIIPIIPLCCFIALNCMILGKIPGLIISYFATIVGCYISYIITKKLLRKPVSKLLAKFKNGDKVMNFINKCNLTNLTIIMAIPFAPAFLINIAAGLSDKLKNKIFLLSLVIGKIFMVYFWGFIGANLKECFTNPMILIKVGIMVVLAYVISTVLNKKFGLK